MACNTDRALTISDVDVATIANLTGASGLPVLYGGGLADFQQALTGTDAAITPPLLQRALNVAVEGTFNAITVDGDTSTNDTALALASGAAENVV